MRWLHPRALIAVPTEYGPLEKQSIDHTYAMAALALYLDKRHICDNLLQAPVAPIPPPVYYTL